MSTLERLRAAIAARYDVDKEIGAGGMATVFLGHDLKHERDVAIKVLHPDLGAALGSERFLSEIKTTAKLQHPHILPLLDSGEADSLLYYVMPFVVGESLRQRIDRERQLPIQDAVRVTKEVASALDYAHRHGVIHRDIKPENILLHDGQALVADFGIALAVSAAGGGRLTQTGLSLGTPQYMSPEQAVGERTIDARSDIYSLGAVTYEMLTGEPPFAGATVQAIVSKIMTEKPTPISRLRETVPEMVDDAVMIALAKLPADRFATAAEFASGLTTHVSGFSRTAAVERGGPGRRRADFFRQRGVIALTALAAILLATTLWASLKPQPAPRVARFVLALDSTEALNGPVGRVAISPDGSSIAFIGGPNRSVFVRRLDDLHVTQLPGASDAVAPFFSPDGQTVGFATPNFQLKVISLKGGPPTPIMDSVVGRSGATWGSDGWIYTSNREATAIVRLRPTTSSSIKPVTVLDSARGEVAHRLPDAIPNGKAILFTVYYGTKGRTGSAIAVQRIGERTHTVLVDGLQARYSASGHLLYVTSNGTLMAVRFDAAKLKTTGDPVPIADGVRSGTIGAIDLGISANGTLIYTAGAIVGDRQLIWVSRDGQIKQVDSSWSANFEYPALSPDNSRLAVDISAGAANDIWIKQLDHGPRLKLTFEGTINQYPAWTPDGNSVTYESNANRAIGSTYSLWTKRADGSARAILQVRQENKDPSEAVWSRDGRWLIVRTGILMSGSGDIMAIRPGVDSVLTPLVATTFVEVSPDLSPDARFLVYASNETGRSEIYVVPFPNAGSAKWPISSGGGSEPRWSHHGDEIFYRDLAGNMISVPVKTKPTFSFGVPTKLFSAREFASFNQRRQYDVSSDDSRFLMIRFATSPTPDKLIVVTNWFDELKEHSRK